MEDTRILAPWRKRGSETPETQKRKVVIHAMKTR